MAIFLITTDCVLAKHLEKLNCNYFQKEIAPLLEYPHISNVLNKAITFYSMTFIACEVTFSLICQHLWSLQCPCKMVFILSTLWISSHSVYYVKYTIIFYICPLPGMHGFCLYCFNFSRVMFHYWGTYLASCLGSHVCPLYPFDLFIW
jgi:hypothetical protein